MKKENLIFTNDNCVGCNKCIKACPAIGVNTAVGISKDVARIQVDGSKCIQCGTCLKNCEHGARQFRDDMEEVLEALQKGERIVILVAPSFFLSLPDDYGNIISYLRSLGFLAIYNVSFGANITTWSILKYMKSTGRTGLISSACPAVVSYIEKYKPELISRLMPVMSPVGCLQTYLRSKVYTDPEADIKYAFLCPCIGKHEEYTTYPDGYVLDYSFTFKSLMEYIKKNDIPLRTLGRSKCDRVGMEGLGQFYPIPGGLRHHIRNFLQSNAFIKQVEGADRVYKYLDTFEKMMKNGDALPYLVDILNCQGGCNEGVATDLSVEDAEILMTRVHNNFTNGYSDSVVPDNTDEEKKDERWHRFDDYMSMVEELDYKDFLRRYNSEGVIEEMKISEDAINDIFISMNKLTEADRKVNCTSCGYRNCREMAQAIYYGYNKPENCVHFVKDELVANKEQLEEILTAISGGSENVGLQFVRSEQIVKHIRDSLLEVEKQREELNNNVLTRNQLFASLTHELRTPLNAIVNMTDMLDKKNLTGEQLENIKSIQTASNGLMDTINEILDFSKMEAGKFNIVEDDYLLHELLGEIVTIGSFRCMEKKIEFRRKLDPTAPNRLIGDMKRIRQVMINIVGNAIKYTAFGSVSIEAGWNHDKENPVMSFSVTDTGVGIRQEDIPYLFDAFKQVNEKENKHIVGTGLGLSISKNISDAMGGRIVVESNYGHGSRFVFYVPQKISSYEPISKAMAQLGPVGHGAKQRSFYVPTCRVLVVDDFRVNLHIARTFLDKYQIYVDTAESGPEAVRKCSENDYDIIFMDHNMPDMNGLEAACLIKEKKDRNADTPIVYMSAMDEEQMSDIDDAGVFAAFLEKPLKKEMLDRVLLKLVPTEAVLMNEDGFIPTEEELKAAIEARDINELLRLGAGLEIYSEKKGFDEFLILVKKYRGLLQQGNLDGVLENSEAMQARCRALRNGNA